MSGLPGESWAQFADDLEGSEARPGREVRSTMPVSPRITIRHWRFLHAIDEFGSIGSAARNTHHSESVVRRHVKELASACAADVLDTSAGRARLTPSGKRLLKEWRVILEEWESLEERMTELLLIGECETGGAPGASWSDRRAAPAAVDS